MGGTEDIRVIRCLRRRNGKRQECRTPGDHDKIGNSPFVYLCCSELPRLEGQLFLQDSLLNIPEIARSRHRGELGFLEVVVSLRRTYGICDVKNKRQENRIL